MPGCYYSTDYCSIANCLNAVLMLVFCEDNMTVSGECSTTAT